MSLLTLALIGATIVVSSFLSGVFGLAGGMVLLGVLLVFRKHAVKSAATISRGAAKATTKADAL